MSWYMPIYKRQLNLSYSTAKYSRCVNLYKRTFREALTDERIMKVRHTLGDGSEVGKQVWLLAYDVDIDRFLVTDDRKIYTMTANEVSQIEQKLVCCLPIEKTYDSVKQGIASSAFMRWNGYTVVQYRRLPLTVVPVIMQQLQAVHSRAITTQADLMIMARAFTQACRGTKLLANYPVDMYDYQPLYEAIFLWFIEIGLFDMCVSYDMVFTPHAVANDFSNMAIGTQNTYGGQFAYYALNPSSVSPSIEAGYTPYGCAPTIYINAPELPEVGYYSGLSIYGFYEAILFGVLRIQLYVALIYVLCSVLDLSNITAVDNTFVINVYYSPNIAKIILPKVRGQVAIYLTKCPTNVEVYTARGEAVPVKWEMDYTQNRDTVQKTIITIS